MHTNWEWFSKFQKARGKDYDKLKETFGESAKKTFFKIYPKAEKHLDYYELYTPLTFVDLLGRPEVRLKTQNRMVTVVLKMFRLHLRK